MKIFIFGSGVIYSQTKKWLANQQVLGILDNSLEKQGTLIDGYIVYPPHVVKNFQYDRIYILSLYVRDMRKQLRDIGVPDSKIFYVFNLIDLGGKPYFKEYKTSRGDLQRGRYKLILISHDLSITGGQNCLLNATKCLCNNGYSVIVASPIDGEMRNLFLEAGADVIVDEKLLVSRGESIDWLRNYDLLFVNTVQLYYLLDNRDDNIPTIWWVHEPPLLYKSVLSSIMGKISMKKLRVCSVSTVSDNAFRKVVPNIKPNRLVYGILDLGMVEKRYHKGIMKFVVIGAISKLKGHDIILSAIETLAEEILAKCEFVFIGADDSSFANSIKKEVKEKNLPIKFYGSLPHEETMGILGNMNMLICASREETMSMAIVEAAMKGIPTIIPSKIGNSDFFINNESSCVFHQNDSESLAKCILHCIENYDQIIKYREKAREIYIKNFTIEKFNTNILNCVSQMLSLNCPKEIQSDYL